MGQRLLEWHAAGTCTLKLLLMGWGRGSSCSKKHSSNGDIIHSLHFFLSTSAPRFGKVCRCC